MGFADFLNVQTANLIDWNRPGSLFFGNHRYSAKELAERGAIIASAAIAGYLSWNLTESPGYAALGACVGFLVSHAVTMYPLIKKRIQAKSACESMKLELERQFPPEEDTEHTLAQNISAVVKTIMEHTASKSPSEIWGKRARLLSTLVEWICDQHKLDELLQSPDIIIYLDQNNRVHTPSCSL